MKEIILSAAVDGRDKYSETVKGLEKSIVDANWQGDVEIYKEFPDWIIPHKSIPYAFKYQIILKKLKEGYERIFWLDSTMRLVAGKSISDLLSGGEYGIVAFDNLGHALSNYINDTAIKNLDLFFSYPEEDISSMPQVWGGALFFNFKYDYVLDFLDELLRQLLIGSFNEDKTNRPGFIGHRHDQAVVSGLINLFQIPILPYGIIAAPKDVTEKTYIQYGDH